MKLPDPGLYRTHKPYPGHEDAIPAGVLVYVGVPTNGGLPFVVRPGANRNNRWYWGEPTIPLRAQSWADGLLKLACEAFLQRFQREQGEKSHGYRGQCSYQCQDRQNRHEKGG